MDIRLTGTGRHDVTLRLLAPPVEYVTAVAFSVDTGASATDGVTAEQQANRKWLRDGMAAGGLSVYSGEWWHFDGPGANVDQPILDVSLTRPD